MGLRLPRIWLVTMPEARGGPVSPIRRALQDCPSDLVGVQLRAKKVTDRQLVAWARELRDVTRARNAVLTINGRPDVAEIADADGVHLPERGLSVPQIRAEWPALSLVGASKHDIAGLRQAETERASFAFLSPVFGVPGKGRALGIDSFSAAIAAVGIPTYALGGISAEDVPALLRAGARGIAVRRAIYDAPDPKRALRELLDVLDKADATSEEP